MRKQDDASTYYLTISRDTDYNGIPRCINCNEPADDVHEIIPRSSFGKLSRHVLFDIKNRCCLCRKCHMSVHNDIGRGKLMSILQERHKYEYEGIAQCLLQEYMASQ